MRHRHLQTTAWTPMAVESLLDRGGLADWREFFAALQHDDALAEIALRIAEGHEDTRSAALVRMLVSETHRHLAVRAANKHR